MLVASLGLHPSERFPLEEPVTSRCQCPPGVTSPTAVCDPGNEVDVSVTLAACDTPGEAAQVHPEPAMTSPCGDPPTARPEGRGASPCKRPQRSRFKEELERTSICELDSAVTSSAKHYLQTPSRACSEEPSLDRCSQALPVTVRRRPKSSANGPPPPTEVDRDWLPASNRSCSRTKGTPMMPSW